MVYWKKADRYNPHQCRKRVLICSLQNLYRYMKQRWRRHFLRRLLDQNSVAMFRLVLLIAILRTPVVVVCSRPTANSSSSKMTVVTPETARTLIVEGVVVNPENYSFFVLTASDAYDTTRDNVCGAVLIHPDILISAAHCHGFFNYGVRLYSTQDQQFNRRARIVEQWRHPNFNIDNDTYNWDVMVMRLEEPIYDIVPVVLNSDPNIPVEDEILKAVGFGALEYQGELSNVLLQGEFEYMIPSVCDDRINRYQVTGAESGDELLCTGPTEAGNSICLGDSGGPLLTLTGELVGIVSWTVQCQSGDIPDGFARISTVYDWIQQIICDISVDKPSTCPTPSSSSSNPLNSMVEMRLGFRHDFSPEDTTFAVRNLETGTIEYAGPTYVVPDRVVTTFWNSTFYLSEGRYSFEVYDKQQNGLSDTELNTKLGFWELYGRYQDGTTDFSLVASGDHLFFEESITDFEITFSDSFRTPSPTPLPTISPAPTGPTTGPTFGLTDNVTVTPFPTNFTSVQPSTSPTTPPGWFPIFSPAPTGNDLFVSSSAADAKQNMGTLGVVAIALVVTLLALATVIFGIRYYFAEHPPFVRRNGNMTPTVSTIVRHNHHHRSTLSIESKALYPDWSKRTTSTPGTTPIRPPNHHDSMTTHRHNGRITMIGDVHKDGFNFSSSSSLKQSYNLSEEAVTNEESMPSSDEEDCRSSNSGTRMDEKM